MQLLASRTKLASATRFAKRRQHMVKAMAGTVRFQR